jgi:hypothetical protein
MELSLPSLVVAFELSPRRKAILAEALASAAPVVYLTEVDETARAEVLRKAGVLLTFNTAKELRPGEAVLLKGARLIQFMIGGVDFIPLGELPKGVPVATNGGAYAESSCPVCDARPKRTLLQSHQELRGKDRSTGGIEHELQSQRRADRQFTIRCDQNILHIGT